MGILSRFFAIFGSKSKPSVSIVSTTPIVVETTPIVVETTPIVVETTPIVEPIGFGECDISVYLEKAITWSEYILPFNTNNKIVWYYRAAVIAKMSTDFDAYRSLVEILVDLVSSKVLGSHRGTGATHVKKGSRHMSPQERMPSAINNDTIGNTTRLQNHKYSKSNIQDEWSATHAIDALFDGILEFGEYSEYTGRISQHDTDSNPDNNPYIAASPSIKAWHKDVTDNSIIGFLCQFARNHASSDNIDRRRGHSAIKGYLKKHDAYETDIPDTDTFNPELIDINKHTTAIANDIYACILEWVDDTDDKLPIVWAKRMLSGKDHGADFFKRHGISKSNAYRRISPFKKLIKAELENFADESNVILGFALKLAFSWA